SDPSRDNLRASGVESLSHSMGCPSLRDATGSSPSRAVEVAMRLSFALCLAVVLAGCGRDAAPIAPRTAARTSLESASTAVTKSGKLDDLWPSADGHSWSYDLR